MSYLGASVVNKQLRIVIYAPLLLAYHAEA